MALSVAPLDSQIFTALRGFLLGIVPAGTEVIRAQGNRTPEPIGADFITMNPVSRVRLSTNIDTYSPDPFPTTKQIRMATQANIQIEVHGPNGADTSEMIVTLMRDDYACQVLGPSGVQPLYAGDARQLPFINAEAQWEDRWIVEVALQVNPVTTVPQAFADSLEISVQEANIFVNPNGLLFVYDAAGNLVLDAAGNPIFT